MRKIQCWRFGKWARHFEKCIVCGNDKKNWKNRHKGNGLCIKCYDKQRAKNPARNKRLKNQRDRWYTRVKDTEEYKKYCRKNASEWQKQKPQLHRKNWKKMAKKNSFKRFILSNAYNKTKKGIEILIEGQRVKTNILPPTRRETDMDRVVIESNLFREVYRNLTK
jgi:hypothetical protein